MWLALAIVLLVVIFSQSRLYTAAQGWLDDALVAAWDSGSERPSVLIVEVNAAENYGLTQWQTLFDALVEAGPQALVFRNWPAEWLTAPPQSLHESLFVLGTQPFVRVNDKDFNAAGHLAAAPLPALEEGVARVAWLSLPAEMASGSEMKDPQPTLVARAAGAVPVGQGEVVRVNFMMGDGAIPVLDAGRVLTGDLLAEMVAGNVVLIGAVSPPGQPGLVTPLSQDYPLLSPLHFDAYAIETLLSRSAIEDLAGWQVVLCLGLICILALWGYQYLTLLYAVVVTLFCAALYLLVAGGTLHFLHLRVPVTLLWLVQGLCFLSVFYSRRLAESRAMSRLAWGLNAKVKARMIPTGFMSSDNPWPQITALINQTLQLRRTILLSVVEGESRVQEIQALGCSLDDIDEQRRDYRRTPYLSAVEKAAPYRLSRPYLRDSSDNKHEVQYLIPLLHDETVLGFWAFGIDAQQMADVDEFETLIDDFAQQIAELLYQRIQWQLGERRKPLRELLNLRAGTRLHRELRHTLGLIERRLTGLERGFEILSTAAATYDLFGWLTYANAKFEALAAKAGVSLYEKTALDLLVALTGLSVDEARARLRDVLVAHQEVRLTAEKIQHIGRFDLHLRPFRPLEGGEAEASLSRFQTSGIMFEVIDLSQVSSIAQLREDLLIHYQAQLRNDLGTLSMAHQLINTPGLEASRQALASQMIDQKLTHSVNALSMMESELAKVSSLADAELFPTALPHLIEQTLRAYEVRYEQSLQDRFAQPLPTLVSLVMVDKLQMQDVLTTALRLLIEDSKPDAPLALIASERQDEGVRVVELRLANQGFGMPGEQIATLQTADPDSITDPLLSQLLRARVQMTDWGTRMQILSELDQGYEIIFEMRGLKFHE